MKIFVLLGESGSGKDTIAKEIIKNCNLSRVVTTTTRSIRDNEMDGVDYNFTTENNFKNLINQNQLIEYNIFKNWYYGLPKKSIENSSHENLLVVLNPGGLRTLSKYAKEEGHQVIPIYIYCSERTRLIRTLERNDNIDEVIRRAFADREDFEDIISLLCQCKGYMVRNEDSLEVAIQDACGIIGDYLD